MQKLYIPPQSAHTKYMQILLTALGISLIINVVLFIAAYLWRSDKLTDASYALSFIAVALYGFSQAKMSWYHLFLLLLIGIWALRIGSFLLYRVMKVGKDARFDGIRESFWRFLKFWIGQAVTVWILMLPAILAFSHTSTILHISRLGGGIWAIGLIIEAIADIQKYRFSRNPKNKNKWIASGIWHYSRHPNYFGEILVWTGVYLYALTVLPTADAIIGLVSPLFITILLLFVSGIPILEKSADKRWGKQVEYQAYKKRTSILIPWPVKK